MEAVAPEGGGGAEDQLRSRSCFAAARSVEM
jgi:hypothetical protein